MSIIESIASTLKEKKHVLIITHIGPDGDAIGSAVALAHVAQHAGADVRIFLPAGRPDYLAWLPVPCPIFSNLTTLKSWVPDLVAAVDCGDGGRVGVELARLFSEQVPPIATWGKPTTLNIDHHLGNPEFADINWVDPHCAATGELIGLLAEYMGLELSGDLGLAVYLALVSDTGTFTYSNTSARCLALAARIFAAGLDVAEFTNKYENTWTLARMHLWGRLLSEVTLHAKGAISCCVVPHWYLKEFGLDKSALEGFASMLRRIRNVRVGVFIREDAQGYCKISLRSMGDVDVRDVAVHFGGGGHAAAAGAEVELPIETVAEDVLARLKKLV